tara:strand:+ start:217 stop:645 length:429 start_codon:yes stop_codon:yes gene_type:complete
MPSYSVENVSNKSKRSTRLYKDLDLDFGRNIVTNDVNKLTDVEAVKRSVRNLIQTNHFERPFHPEIGGNVRALLFEPVAPLTALNLQRKIEEVLNNFEPRIKLVQIIARPDIDRNRYQVSISFYVIGVSQPITVETFLERLR